VPTVAVHKHISLLVILMLVVSIQNALSKAAMDMGSIVDSQSTAQSYPSGLNSECTKQAAMDMNLRLHRIVS
jgi:hypothetical protein